MTASTTPSYSTQAQGQTGIAFDFSPYFDRMATALETIATNSTDMKDSLSTLATLANGNGIHMIGAWDYIGIYETIHRLKMTGADFAKMLAEVESAPRDFS